MATRGYGNGSIEGRGKSSWRVTYYGGRDPLTGEVERFRYTVRGTKREAEKALREALSKMDQGIAVSPEKVTVGEWLVRWLEQHRVGRGIASTTHARYESLVRLHLAPALGRLRLQELRRHHVETFYSNDAISASTRQKARVVLIAALSAAVRGGLLAANPADGTPPPKVKKSEQRALDESEVGALLGAAEGTGYEVPIRLTLATGLREGELLGMKWTDLDLERGTLSVERSLRWLNGKYEFTGPKTRNGRRTVELSASTVALLTKHRARQAAQRLALGPVWSDFGLVFPSAVGTPREASNFLRGYKPIVTRAGIARAKEVKWHTLRHTATTLWIKAGGDILTVSRRLGHGSAAFTMNNYGHLLPGQQQHVAHALDHLLA